MEKDQPGVGDERFVQALGRGERPSGRGGIYGAGAGAGSMYAGSEASLGQPPMSANDGHWGQAGGYDSGVSLQSPLLHLEREAGWIGIFSRSVP